MVLNSSFKGNQRVYIFDVNKRYMLIAVICRYTVIVADVGDKFTHEIVICLVFGGFMAVHKKYIVIYDPKCPRW